MMMSLKSAKTWTVIVLPLLLLMLSYCCLVVFLGYGITSQTPASNRTLCDLSRRWDSLSFNVSRNRRLFLRLNNLFWNRYPSSCPLPYGVKDSEMLILKVLAVMSNFDMPESVQSLDCRTCVVVGNGFALKNSSLGGTINKYDVVIRLNNGPVRGYEEDVGNKTTVRFFYPESASPDPSVDNEPDTVMVLVPFKKQDILWLKGILYDEKRDQKGFWKPPPQFWFGKTSQIRILDPFFLRSTAKHLLHIPLTVDPMSKQNPVHPTTGILAVFVALNYCDAVHLVGFGYPTAKDQDLPIHYYGEDTMKSMTDSYHNLTHEAEVLKWLEDSGVVLSLRPHR
ncbi:CMP-N-acetylneuraminate-beta-galactosamide-alpha-2,3-sialyltransferase 4-like isoform X2 [Brienomyrus brachyistius]|nr:CMP-N-acetylneuraminate-beta-galactosamide-alpha-2,3-sialyltransferase 4-like isoform X2 [Brienomyrus brachyistius]XP_048853677.1 CMP-N-acetylneuraminate-beta-galactosamide-alpha-2,3-sialyltransferase 4-like isoform X2 [Brienomyrus brachyistius]XP_048853678.1 CMP-N-acetylneuraminate-beta-galactosamide-alpha-2,3-sialyltransferase 4-like isoform X2 [Brienomyrus brachyistius]XP_048853679.1 CMP-N-acetylneuraminate-beta-galactosamide-alpha-2,3-sialyltransferase 4-like isoform X2 [Brienomyrus brach